MSDFGDRSSQLRSEDVACPLCGKAKVRVTFVAGYMSWNISRIAAGAKRTRYFHDPTVRVHASCPECKATRQDIKDALERGEKKTSHEERLQRIRKAGLPTSIETPVK